MDRIIIDIARYRGSVSELCADVETYRARYPNADIFMDGDLYSVIARGDMTDVMDSDSEDEEFKMWLAVRGGA